MIIYFKGHNFRYEIENLFRMFSPNEPLKIAFEGQDCEYPDGNAIWTEVDGLSVKVNIITNGESRVLTGTAANEGDCERALAVLLYEFFAEFYHRRPVWGILTGVRPVKVAKYALNQTGSAGAAIGKLQSDALVSEEKAALAVKIAQTQSPIEAKALPNSFSLYISIPFCPSRCRYCSFVSHSIEKTHKLIPTYIQLLKREIMSTAQMTKELGLVPATVYIGGGTPTVLTAEQLDEIMKIIRQGFGLDSLMEYTVEAGRPDTITKEKLDIIKSNGATRISINPQTLNDSILEEIGRKHTASQFLEAFKLARTLGFDNINTDLIAGLESDTVESFANSLEKIISLKPENITVHTLSVKRAATQTRDVLSNENERAAGEMLGIAYDALGQSGYMPYYLYRQKGMLGNLENTGFCRPGFEGLYNIFMMEEVHSVLACGAGAVTKLVDTGSNRIKRICSYKYPYEYVRNFAHIENQKKGIVDFYGSL